MYKRQACIAGAQGGCQAECGSAAAMAAAALVELCGGAPDMLGDAVSISLGNVLGLVWDPVAGLVEIPCIHRNAAGVAGALVAAQLALAGICLLYTSPSRSPSPLRRATMALTATFTERKTARQMNFGYPVRPMAAMAAAPSDDTIMVSTTLTSACLLYTSRCV